MSELFDLVFTAVTGVFAVMGVVLILLGAGLAVYLGRFHSRAGEVQARVVAHEDTRLSADRETGEERRGYKPVFELADGPDAGVRHTSSEVHMHNAYPIGTVWPAKYDPASGAIRTERALTIWPFLCTGFVVGGLAFIIVPNLPALDGETALPVALVLIGLGVIAAGIVTHFSRRRSGPRSLEVMAKLVAIEVHKDTERHDYDVPVMRILGGPYEGVETCEVDLRDFDREDIGQTVPAAFDPYNGKLAVTAGRFRPSSMVLPLVATGAIFAAIGLVMASGVF
ncbi:DUF3592 domain-containing protein [Alteraurantiacibacter aquimixticola]|uniref:DUF3592 domain-containing protein n=1 Tax=Alteraurantiacibacter aquimixticola TaxID=2489173 RepID=A0A4T3F040_9SPHN|nr:DUF3592 domain-containing protein [Alteraurantiacibacter aquimixticola]TIX50389.1 DUF3592 domain-containing protein [Alteraurantiacibacter aquimixticola]